MVVDGHSQLLLCLVLADDVVVEEAFDFLGLGQVSGGGSGMRGVSAVVFKDGVTDSDTLIAYICSWIIAGRRDQLRYSVLRFVAERAPQRFFRSRARFHFPAPFGLTDSTAFRVLRATYGADQ